MYAEVYLEPIGTSIVEVLCKNHKKTGIAFTIEKVYRMSIFI